MVAEPFVASLVAVGIGFLLYGLLQAYQLRQHLQMGTVKESWDLLSALITLFIIGYAMYLANIVFNFAPIDLQLLNAVIFFFAAVFVAVTAYVSKMTFTT